MVARGPAINRTDRGAPSQAAAVGRWPAASLANQLFAAMIRASDATPFAAGWRPGARE